MRTHYCGEINESLFDEYVELCGWVHRCRNLGGLVFIDLRDRAGIVQIVVNPEHKLAFSIAEKLHNEYVIRLKGFVRPRPENMINDTMLTGKTEIACNEIELINKAKPLPFQINEVQEANEELRLKYRYIDLRRPEMSAKLILRAKVAREIRDYLDERGFLEIETPMLTRSTPEGARDYLVPSRNFTGSFYALPQSPQQFKQLLMMAGFDRYYQIVRCFRDEDLRADRQPEFTQLDVETSFLNEEQIQDILEGLIRKLFSKMLNVALPDPLPRMTFAEAMEKYGTDRPDLRLSLQLVSIGDLVSSCEFKVFTSAASDPEGRVAAMRVPKGSNLSRKDIESYENYIAKWGAKGLAYIKVYDIQERMDGIKSPIAKFIDWDTAKSILQRVKAENDDIIFIVAGRETTVNDAMAALRIKIGEDFKLIEPGWRPVWIVDFPMFEPIEGGGWTFKHHPFTSPTITDTEELLKNPGKSLSRAYDMVLNGSEIGGGSIRIHDPKLQLAVFEILGISEEKAREKFGHLIAAFDYGCPPHGGIAFGFDRIVMLMTEAKSIRDVIAFPKTQTAQCPLTDAPSKVSAEQLYELGLKIVPDTV